MTVPDDGVARLMWFVDGRLARLGMSKEQMQVRGGPDPTTLLKVLGRPNQHTPRVSTLSKLDRVLGWEPGSAAVVLLGGSPKTVTTLGDDEARNGATGHAVLTRILAELRAQIIDARAGVTALENVHDWLADELHEEPIAGPRPLQWRGGRLQSQD